MKDTSGLFVRLTRLPKRNWEYLADYVSSESVFVYSLSAPCRRRFNNSGSFPKQGDPNKDPKIL